MEGSHFSAKILKFLMQTDKNKRHLFCQHASKTKHPNRGAFCFAARRVDDIRPYRERGACS
jgi:hypothetical protein